MIKLRVGSLREQNGEGSELRSWRALKVTQKYKLDPIANREPLRVL